MKPILTVLAGLAATLPAPAVHAQQFNEPWTFKRNNRAQIAVVIRQVQETGSVNGGAGGVFASASPGLGGTTIVCGGGSATAQANNTCVILNNSTGEISTDQVSDGDQSATNSETVNGAPASDVDEIISTLAQN